MFIRPMLKKLPNRAANLREKWSRPWEGGLGLSTLHLGAHLNILLICLYTLKVNLSPDGVFESDGGVTQGESALVINRLGGGPGLMRTLDVFDVP